MVNIDSNFILQLSQAMCRYNMRMRKVEVHVIQSCASERSLEVGSL